MALRLQIQCVLKDDEAHAHTAISHVGGVLPDGQPWMLTIRDAVAGALNGTYSFFTLEQNREAEVYVRESRVFEHHPLFLTTSADGFKPNNLLALVACPWRAA